MIEIISGTNRPGSNTLKVAKHLLELYQAKGVEAGIIDLTELPAGVFTPEAYAEKPAEFSPFCDRILKADGLHVVTPEYNGSFPGVLKLYIDMMKFPESFENRCVCFTGVAAGAWGGLRPVEHLQQVFGYRNAQICPNRVFVNLVHTKLDADGTPKEDFLKQLFEKQVADFYLFVERNKGLTASA
ncbi:MAG: NADPH-dependent FMN reductase [Sumerlaeia bacterium]